VRLLEGVLREQQGSWRDPGRYYLSVFGTPGRFPWAWRFEGHHLSLNVALPAAGHVAVTPFFVGAHPGDGARRTEQRASVCSATPRTWRARS
jgi:hypothetical protein